MPPFNFVQKIYSENPRFTLDRKHKPFRWGPWVKPLFYITAATYVVVIALVAVATAGYQFVPIVSTSWIDPNSFWFEAFIPTSYRPQTRICGGHSFRIGDSSSLTQRFSCLGISTASPFSLFYNLVDFLDDREGQPLDEMIYENAALTNCSVGGLSLTQSVNGSATVEVISPMIYCLNCRLPWPVTRRPAKL
jgi:hypothetical protein